MFSVGPGLVNKSWTLIIKKYVVTMYLLIKMFSSFFSYRFSLSLFTDKDVNNLKISKIPLLLEKSHR
ncbi:hypothetical protein GCM10008918_10230 [Lactobacillus kefiranofaciens subsp. kefiranofaciens]